MDALLEALRVDEPIGALDRPALDLARIEYPDLDPEPYVAMLDELARRVEHRMASSSGPEFISAANLVLFGEFGVTGNEADYYDPRNSFLNDVLTRRTGIPITLSVIYMEVARRLGQPVYGVNLPGHFIIRYDDGEYAVFIDPFRAGKILTRNECAEMARKVTAVDVSEEAFAPAPTRSILLRMLNNLRAIYIDREQCEKLLLVLDLLLRADAGSAEDHKLRGMALVQLGQLRRGSDDFRRYIELAPQAPDRAWAEKQLRAIHRIVGRLN